MLIQFLKNKDGKTTTFLANHQIINDEVPYIPEKVVDHRGLALYLFCGETLTFWDELKFGEGADENFSELERGFDYMFNPIFVKEEIEAREYQKKRAKRAPWNGTTKYKKPII